MNGQNCTPLEQEQWLLNLKELKAKTGLHTKQIAERADVSEKAVSRIFSGEAKNPGVDLVRRIIHALGGTWHEIFGESGAVIGGQDLVTLQAEVDKLTAEVNRISMNLNIADLENAVLKDKVAELETEIKILSIKLECAEKLVAVHDFYNKRLND